MEGISRIMHEHQRDLLKILHPKVIKELPTLEEVLDLVGLLIDRVESSSGSDVRLAYFFSSRRDVRDRIGLVESYATEYSRSLHTRRTWAIVAYPLEERAAFIPKQSFIDQPIKSWEWWEWHLIRHKEVKDPILFYRPAPQNNLSENAIFFFSQNPANQEYLNNLKSQQRLLGFPVIGPSLYLV